MKHWVAGTHTWNTHIASSFSYILQLAILINFTNFPIRKDVRNYFYLYQSLTEIIRQNCYNVSTAPEKPESVAETSQMGPPVVPSTRSTITPRRQLQNVLDQATPGFETPVINKRLNHVLSSSSQSPFHVATPDSPYGQLFKPDPSPETRKEWAKWIDGLPDFRVEEPPPKKRATVTVSLKFFIVKLS